MRAHWQLFDPLFNLRRSVSYLEPWTMGAYFLVLYVLSTLIAAIMYRLVERPAAAFILWGSAPPAKKTE